jgi:hypothetical protein
MCRVASRYQTSRQQCTILLPALLSVSMETSKCIATSVRLEKEEATDQGQKMLSAKHCCKARIHLLRQRTWGNATAPTQMDMTKPNPRSNRSLPHQLEATIVGASATAQVEADTAKGPPEGSQQQQRALEQAECLVSVHQSEAVVVGISTTAPAEAEVDTATNLPCQVGSPEGSQQCQGALA